jgi:large subunit ribosomal protein L3
MDMLLLGRKIGMSQLFLPDGTRKGVSIVQFKGCVVVDKRTLEKDGYTALVIGSGEVTGDPRRIERLVGKPMMGRFKKLGVPPLKTLVEFRCKPAVLDKYTVGQALNAEAVGLKEGDRIDIAGTSKGRGFAGVMKRHHFAGGRATHGTHEYRRHGGAIGARAEPGRVFPGKRMGGQMGNERSTIQYVKVLKVLPEENVILLDGPVAGYNTALVELRPTTKLHKVRIRKEEKESTNPMKQAKAAAAGKKGK